jgi:hypothetical protein
MIKKSATSARKKSTRRLFDALFAQAMLTGEHRMLGFFVSLAG